jgi:hypothetical protein
MNDTRSAQHDDSQPLRSRTRKKRLAQATIEETALGALRRTIELYLRKNIPLDVASD